MNDSTRIASAIAVLALCLVAVGIGITMASDDADAAITDYSKVDTHTFHQGDTWGNYRLGTGSTWSGSIPGITLSKSGSYIVGNGTLSSIGSYPITIGSTTHYVFVMSTSTVIPTSFSVSGSSSTTINVGETVTYTMSSSPSNAVKRLDISFSDDSVLTTDVLDDTSASFYALSAGTCRVQFYEAYTDTTVTRTITVVEPTPVTSISISGSSTVDIGSRLTLTATATPSSADNRHVEWSITSGSSRVTYTTSDTTTGGRIVLTGVSAGSVTVKATAADGSGVSKTKTITVEVPEYWYYINYDANGGSGGPDRTGDTATDTSSTLSIQVSSEKPTRSGYTFLGWSKSSTATSPTYYGGEWIDVTYDDVQLYAIWKQNTQNFYAYLNYNANGGSGAPGNQSAYINAVSASGSKTFTIPSTVPTRSGYEFQGWSTNSNATTASYDAGDTISVAYGSTVNLYAVWKQAVITVTGTPDAHGIVGSSWRYTPTINTSGCSISVSGASWLVASNGTVSGTPTAPGDYAVTLTVSKTNYTSGTQTFTVTVLSNLSFTSSPTGGAIIYAV